MLKLSPFSGPLNCYPCRQCGCTWRYRLGIKRGAAKTKKKAPQNVILNQDLPNFYLRLLARHPVGNLSYVTQLSFSSSANQLINHLRPFLQTSTCMSARHTTRLLTSRIQPTLRLKQLNNHFPRKMATSIPKTMSGVLVEKTGGVEVLEYKTDLPVPTPKEDQVLVKNDFIGINYIDT